VGILRRETYERLREELSRRGTAGRGGVGLALAELVWTLSASLVDELGRVIRPDADRRRVEGKNDG
jgi:hypothetical protein